MFNASRLPWIPLLVAFVLGCSGGGGPGPGGREDIGSVADESATGVWRGTYRLAGAPAREFSLIVAPSGELAGLIAPTTLLAGDPRLIAGTSETSGAQLLATGRLFALAGTLPSGERSAPFAELNGVVTEGVSLSGTVAAGGETGAFSLTYDPSTSRGASLGTLQGVYVTSTGTSTMAITSAGAVTFNSISGCVGNGTIAIVDPASNIYSWTLTITGCAARGEPAGLATLDDATAGGGDNRLTMIGSQESAPFFFIGTK